ncbi:MAG: extracellular solute-binding protein [Acetobacteraceae bacterium]
MTTPNARLTRRGALKLAATAALPLVHIRTSAAAGKLALAFWDHWVPGGNDVMTKQINAWAAQNKVEVSVDYMGAANKLLMTAAMEEQSKTGHDVIALPSWEVHNHSAALAPVDDVMQRLVAKYGPTNKMNEYLARPGGHWIAVPSNSGSQNLPPVVRISVLKASAGFDAPAAYPVSTEYTPAADAWTWDALLAAAEAGARVGMPFALGLSNAGDCVTFCGALFSAFGAQLVDAKGNIMVRSDEVRQVLDYGARLVKFLPQDVLSYDSASNNRALIAGKSALIFNPPSVLAVAQRDQPQIAADCWTVSAPRGPKGRYVPFNPFFWGLWSFSRNQTAAKELLEFLSDRPQVEERTTAVMGYDIPPFESMQDFKIWEDVGPPRGVVYHYPVRASDRAQADVAGAPAPPEIAVQIYNTGTMPLMLAKLFSGTSIPDTIKWAEEQLEGFVR